MKKEKNDKKNKEFSRFEFRVDRRAGKPESRFYAQYHFCYILNTRYYVLILLSLLAKKLKNREYKQ